MKQGGRRSIQAWASASLPFLRVIGLMYTGLGAMLALVVVVAVGVTPVAPVLEQAAEPARQAVTSLMQPTGDAVVGLLGGNGVVVVEQRRPAVPVFSPTLAIDVTIEEVTQTDDAVVGEPMVNEAPPAVAVPIAWTPGIDAWPALAEPVEAEVIVEDEPLASDSTQPERSERSEPSEPSEGLVVQAGEPVLVIAEDEAPKPLPTPTSTETPQQLKARLDAENRAAIEAQKAAQARAKADAEAANRAAIEAAKQDKANADAQTRAANAAAIAAAKGATSKPVAVPAPTAAPAAAPPPAPEPPAVAAAQIDPPPADPNQPEDVATVDESQLDEAPINMALDPCESGT